jgi:DNA polymerase-3 subunit delta
MTPAARRAATAPDDTTSGSAAAPVYLVRGDDPSLVRDAVAALVDDLVGDADPAFAVEDLAGDYEIAALVDAAHTPPFLTDRRVVVGRAMHRFTSADDVNPVVAYLEDPLPTTHLVLVWETGRVPKPLLDAVKRSGQQVDTSPGRSARDQAKWLDQHVAADGLRLDREARELLMEHLGDNLGRAPGILATLAATYGSGAHLGADEVAPFLGEEGGVAPWALTDAIDGGNIPATLALLHRTLGDRHPLQVMATLSGHYRRLLRLDGVDITSTKEAMSLLGISEYPARKAKEQATRLGHDRIVRAVSLLAEADLDLRGARALPADLVLELLVARLAQLAKR